MFIIRTAFWLSVVVLLLPIGKDEQAPGSGEQMEQSNLSAGDAFSAALATVGDVAGICQRKPEVCDTGSAVWQTFQMKARYGAKLLYRWAQGDEPEAGNDELESQAGLRENASLRDMSHGMREYRVSENVAPVHTGSATKRNSRSQNTLKIEDLIPEWKGPPKQVRA